MMPLAATECLLNSQRSVSVSSSQHYLSKDTQAICNVRKDPWDTLAIEYVDSLMTSCFSTKTYETNLENFIVLKPIEAYEEE